MFTLKMFGSDLLETLSVAEIVAEVAEPIVDLTNPGIAQIYNLSVQQAGSLLSAFLNRAQPAPAAAPPPPAPAPAPLIAKPSAEGPVTVGPGLHNVVPA